MVVGRTAQKTKEDGMKIKRRLKHKMNISIMMIFAFIFINLSGCAAGFLGWFNLVD
jgi:hypothetical protein